MVGGQNSFTAFILNPATRNPHSASRNLNPATLNPQPATRNLQPATIFLKYPILLVNLIRIKI